jgi:hypothetical protein
MGVSGHFQQDGTLSDENVFLVYVQIDRSVLFNEAVNSWVYAASVVDKWNFILAIDQLNAQILVL